MRSQSGHLKDVLLEVEEVAGGRNPLSFDVPLEEVKGVSSKTLTMPRTSEQRFSFSLLVRVASRFKEPPAKPSKNLVLFCTPLKIVDCWFCH